MDVPDRRETGEWYRVFVCPRDYLQFAPTEQARWTPLGEESPDAPVPDATRPPLPDRRLQELVTLLSGRGLTGWALLVRDVGEGRIRRVHLRRLPADPQIREEVVSYLRSAGADITLGLGLRTRLQHEHDQRDTRTDTGPRADTDARAGSSPSPAGGPATDDGQDGHGDGGQTGRGDGGQGDTSQG
jgi:hypothetical protein